MNGVWSGGMGAAACTGAGCCTWLRAAIRSAGTLHKTGSYAADDCHMEDMSYGPYPLAPYGLMCSVGAICSTGGLCNIWAVCSVGAIGSGWMGTEEGHAPVSVRAQHPQPSTPAPQTQTANPGWGQHNPSIHYPPAPRAGTTGTPRADTALRPNVAPVPDRGGKKADGTHLVPRAGRIAGGGSCTCRCCSKPRRRRRMSRPAGTRWPGSRARHPCNIRGGHRIPLLPCRSSQPPLAATGGERNIGTEWQRRGQAGIAAVSWHSLGP